MKTFQTYVENRAQDEAAYRALNALCYSKDYQIADIAKLPIQQLMADIRELHLLPTESWGLDRFAAMIKSVATDMLDPHVAVSDD